MSIAAPQNDRSALLASLNGAAAGKRSEVAEQQDRFLRLLVTRLRNQDPMNPLENAELTMQLAQMATVEGINRLNEGLQTLLSGYKASQTMQAAALIGRRVLVDGDSIDLVGGVGVAAVELKGAADQVTIRVLDDLGQEVRRFELGRQSAGTVQFVWDGRGNDGQVVADGNYWYTVEARRGGDFVEANPLAMTSVRSVLLTEGRVELDTAGLGPHPLSQVRQIF